MSLERRLLLLSCSRKKRTQPASLSAQERYDGPVFRVLRRFLREYPVQAQNLDTLVLSARYGLISGSKAIRNYDLEMTLTRAKALRPRVLASLAGTLAGAEYGELCMCMGRVYFQALVGYKALIPPDVEVVVSNGSYGHQQAKLHDWLRGTQPEIPAGRAAAQQGEARIRGIQIVSSPSQVLDLARQALAQGIGNPEGYCAWYVQIDEQQVSPKWLVSQLTGLPVRAFHTDDARRALQQLGLEIHRVQPSQHL